MDEFTDNFVPSFLNQEPVVILGLTDSEITLTGIGSTLFALALAIVFGFLAGSLMVGLVIFITSFIGFMFGFSACFKYLKQDKPRGYFGAMLKVRFKLGAKSYYLTDSPLIIGRTNKKVIFYE